MIDVNKYIKIPFKSHGRDFNGCDCYGLVRLVLKEEFSKTLPDFWEYNAPDDFQVLQGLFDENTPLLSAKKVEEPKEGDVVLYKFRGYTSHIAVYVGQGRILHILKGIDSCCVPVEHGILKGRVEGYYEPK